MLSVLLGIALVILAAVLWLAGITLAHAVAVLIGVLGILIIVYGCVPSKYIRLL